MIREAQDPDIIGISRLLESYSGTVGSGTQRTFCTPDSCQTSAVRSRGYVHAALPRGNWIKALQEANTELREPNNYRGFVSIRYHLARCYIHYYTQH